MTPLSDLLATAVAHHRAGRFHEAEKLYRQILQQDPRHADALHLLGLIAQEAGRLDAAATLIQQALAVNPNVPSYHLNLGLVHQAAGQPVSAIECFRQALRLRPDYAEAHTNLGAVLKAQGLLENAAASLREALRLRPDLAEAHSNLGQVLEQQGKLAEAVASCREALRLKPELAEGHYNLAVALRRSGDSEAALHHFRTCLRIKPGYAAAQAGLRELLQALGRPDETVVPMPAADAGAIASAEESFNRAMALFQQGQLDEAVAQFRAGLQRYPGSAPAHNHLGNALQELGRLDEAVAAYRQALAIQPTYADAHNNLGNTLQRAGRLDEAVESYRRALQTQPRHFAAHSNLAVLFKDQGQLDEATTHLDMALAIQPNNTLRVLRATLLPPVYASMDHLHQCRRHVVESVQALRREMPRFDLGREVVSNLFYLAYQGQNDRDLQRELAQVYVAGSGLPPAEARGGDGRKIHVGVLSKYLRDHTIGVLMRGLFATLSRERFTLTALPVNNARDQVTDFIRQHADRYVALPDNLAAVRRTVAELRLDVLFHADIGMDPLTYTLAFSRLAPVQCVTWGHPVTTGIPTIDCFLSSELAEGDDAEGHYTEKLVRLKSIPFYYYRPAAPSPPGDRGRFGLSAEHHVYGCLQTLFKFHPEFDALLAGILRRDPRGLLVLIKGKYPHWDDLLRQRFVRTMPDVLDRIRWLPPQPREEFLNLTAACDVLLDTIHFSGGNTSYEGLALGVPIVTLVTPFMRGRLTHALYRKMGVLDCVAATPAGYIDRAVALGTDPAYRETVAARIRAASPLLFEDFGAVRELEEFFQRAVEEARA